MTLFIHIHTQCVWCVCVHMPVHTHTSQSVKGFEGILYTCTYKNHIYGITKSYVSLIFCGKKNCAKEFPKSLLMIAEVDNIGFVIKSQSAVILGFLKKDLIRLLILEEILQKKVTYTFLTFGGWILVGFHICCPFLDTNFNYFAIKDFFYLFSCHKCD